jgi:uncharacterized protein involved in outer membrane biogenesis
VGEVHLHLYPAVLLEIRDLAIAGQTKDAIPFFLARSVRMKVALFPLLRKQHTLSEQDKQRLQHLRIESAEIQKGAIVLSGPRARFPNFTERSRVERTPWAR